MSDEKKVPPTNEVEQVKTGPRFVNDGPAVTPEQAAQMQKAGGFLDNLKAVDFGRVVTLVEDAAAHALGKEWFAFVADVGALATILGTLGKPAQLKAGAPAHFAHTNPAPAELDRFDGAAANFEHARAQSYAIAPMKAGADGAQPVALDPQTILVALELFSKFVSVIRTWRQTKQQ